jgi:hypothetical protein
MAEENAEQVQVVEEEKEAFRGENTADGRYIPYGGGCLGWFENSGVLKSEIGNDYTLHTAIDQMAVRRKLFHRWGGDVNRRAALRERIVAEVPLNLVWGEHKVAGLTKDFSPLGLRLQFTEDPGLTKGQTVQVHVVAQPKSDETLFEIDSQIMWVSKVGRRSPRWNVGIGFVKLDPEKELHLKAFLMEKSSS